MRHTGRPPVRDGGGLRVRLLALVLVPLIGVGVAAAIGLGDRIGTLAAASRAEDHIRSAAAVDAVRSAFQQEVLPAFSATTARNPALAGTAASAAPLATLEAAAAIIQRLPSLRTATDAAVAALAAHPSVAGTGRGFGVELARVRARLDNPKTAPTAMSGITAFLASMAATEQAQVTAATKNGIGSAGIQALHDLDLAMRATQAAAQELTMFAATQFLNGGSPAALRMTWTQAWGTYAGASAAVGQQTAPSIARQWNAVNATAGVGGFNQFMAPRLVSTAAVPIAKMIDLIIEDGSRNQAYMTVLASALDRALAAGRAQRHDAIVSLVWILSLIHI